MILLIASGASRADAEEAVQEAMIQAWEEWGTLRSPSAWVRTVATRKYWRLAAARKTTEPLGEFVPELCGDIDVAIFEEEQQLVLASLRALPPEQRTVLALLVDGATCKEIAELTGKPEATIRSLLRHARKTLRELM